METFQDPDASLDKAPDLVKNLQKAGLKDNMISRLRMD